MLEVQNVSSSSGRPASIVDAKKLLQYARQRNKRYSTWLIQFFFHLFDENDSDVLNALAD